MRDKYVIEFDGGPLDGLVLETKDKTAYGKLPWSLRAGAKYSRSKICLYSRSLLGDKHYLTYRVDND